MTVLRMVQIIAENLKNFTTKNFSFSNKDTLNKITDTEVYAWGKAAEHAGTQEIHLTDAEKIEVGELVNGKYATNEEVQLVKKSVSDGKSLLAASITGQGINSASDDSFAVMAEKISNIFTGVDASAVTASASDVIHGKQIVDAGGNVIDGAIPDRSCVAGGASNVVGLTATEYPGVAVSEYAGACHWATNTDGVKRFCLQVPWGVYGGTSGTRGGDGYVGIPVSAFGSASPSDILTGKSATSKDGLAIAGTMVNRGAVRASVSVNGSYTIPAGYHNGHGIVSNSCTTRGKSTITPTTSDQTISSGVYLTGNQTIKGDTNLVAGNIKKGVSIFGVTGSLSSVNILPNVYIYQAWGANYTSAAQQSPLYVMGDQVSIPFGSNTPSGSWMMSWMGDGSGKVGSFSLVPGISSPSTTTILILEVSNSAIISIVAALSYAVLVNYGWSSEYRLSTGTRIKVTITDGEVVIQSQGGGMPGVRAAVTMCVMPE